EHLGSKVYDEWFRQLLRNVELCTGEDDTLATWRDRYVLVLLHDGSAEKTSRIIARVQEAWTKRSVPSHPRAVARQIRTASLTAEEFAAHRGRALDVLVARLLQRAPQSRDATSSGRTGEQTGRSARAPSARSDARTPPPGRTRADTEDDAGMIVLSDSMR